MLFHMSWEFIDATEEGDRRRLAAFRQWKPPAGADFKGFYGFVDTKGGVAIIDVDSADTLARVTSPWVPWLRFTTTPIVPVEISSAIAGEAIAFRDSVS
jgi:hypothetical protein